MTDKQLNELIENAYGLYVDTPINSGTIDSLYGVYIGNMSGADTNNYALGSESVTFAR